MRSIWNGAISFGLVSIAVKLYAATEEKHIRFHQIHEADGSRIRYKRMCVGCGDEVAYDDIAKGYDLGGGDMVMLKTGAGTMKLHFPNASKNLKAGDKITVQLGYTKDSG